MRRMFDPATTYPGSLLDAFFNWGESVGTYETVTLMMLGNMPKDDIIRVSFNDDGTADLIEFSPPVQKNKNVPQEQLATWILEAVSMLRIAEPQSLVDGLGFKVSDTVYYIVDKTGESNHVG